MLKAVGDYGKALKPPYHEVRVSYLKKSSG